MNKSVKQYWNALQDIPDELVGCYPMGRCGLLEAPYRHFFELRHLLKEIKFSPEMHILELGCGNGRWVSSLAPLVASYTGVDFSGHAIDIAKKRVGEAGLENVNLYEQSILEFSGNQQYDIIYFSGVTQYLEDSQISKILENLKSNMSESLIIVDRSTINYESRETRSDQIDDQEYYSIYRTPKEIAGIFLAHGFEKTYQKRSYRFMRGSTLLSRKPINKTLSIIAKIFDPFIYYFLHSFSWLADSINPVPFEGGNRSHDFFIFHKDKRK